MHGSRNLLVRFLSCDINSPMYKTKRLTTHRALWGLLLIPYLAISQGELPKLVDPGATRATRALFLNLQETAATNILFGHEDALAYGVEWKDWHRSRSDVKDVCGKHPALFGWEMSKLGKYPHNIDTVDFKQMQAWIKVAYRMGGVNTISWHLDNFVTGGDSWDVGERVVATILPGGVHHAAYLRKLDLFADYVRGLKTGFLFRKSIPIIFRPFHEHTGSWFWWGSDHCTPEEYKELWRFTVKYLRDEKALHNLLWCYSPDVFRDEEHYLERYPGDGYVDILGLDDYHDVGDNGNIRDLTRRLGMVVDLAESRNKIPVLSETGYEAIPQSDWWTAKFLPAIRDDAKAARIAYLMVWRNARRDHHYGPYPGHASAADFRKFSKDPVLLFEPGSRALYRRKK